MDLHLFLNSTAFLTPISMETKQKLDNLLQFRCILNDACGYFQWAEKGSLMASASSSAAAAAAAADKSFLPHDKGIVSFANKHDGTFKLCILLAVDKRSSVGDINISSYIADALLPNSLFLLFDDVCYFVDHTMMSQVGCLKENATETSKAGVLSFNHMHLRFNIPSSTTAAVASIAPATGVFPQTSANDKILTIIALLEKTLSHTDVLKHPFLSKGSKLSDISATSASSSPLNQEVDSLVSYTLENWISLLELVSKTILPSASSNDVSRIFMMSPNDALSVIMKGNKLNRAEDPTVAVTPSRSVCDMYDDISRNFTSSILDMNTVVQIHRYYQLQKEESKIKIDKLIDDLHNIPSDNSGSCVIGTSGKRKRSSIGEENVQPVKQSDIIISAIKAEMDKLASIAEASSILNILPAI